MTAHKSGFVNIIGNPNVGKSTLMNALVGEKMSIITSKPQTTRHRIFGLLSEDDYQVVFSDTPGIIDRPIYGMQSSMNKFAFSSFEDDKFDNIALKMERWFNVKITINNERIKSYKLTGSFENETIDEALKELQYLIAFSYRITGREIEINKK